MIGYQSCSLHEGAEKPLAKIIVRVSSNSLEFVNLYFDIELALVKLCKEK